MPRGLAGPQEGGGSPSGSLSSMGQLGPALQMRHVLLRQLLFLLTVETEVEEPCPITFQGGFQLRSVPGHPARQHQRRRSKWPRSHVHAGSPLPVK